MADMDALRGSDPRHYDDRRAHLVARGVTDAKIQQMVQDAVDHGIQPAKFLEDVEALMVLRSVSADFASGVVIAERRGEWW